MTETITSTSSTGECQKVPAETSYVGWLVSFVWSSAPQQPVIPQEENPLSDWEFVVEKGTDDNPTIDLQELAIFFDDNNSISTNDIDNLVTQINEQFPEYSIDPNQDVIPQICAVKEKMVAAGEGSYLKEVHRVMSNYIFYLPRFAPSEMRDTLLKITTYQQNRSIMSGDISYQRNMLLQYKFSRLSH